MRAHCILLALASTLLLSLGCAATGFSRGEMESALRASNPIYSAPDMTVEEIEKLKPQVALPVRLAVAPPMHSLRWGGQNAGTWSNDEVAVIESWSAPLVRAGIIDRLIILPTAMIEQCSWDDAQCQTQAARRAAARIQADALLVINLATDVDRYLNALAPLNLTIVGMWIIPAHHVDALTIAEGIMLDNRNEYVYAFARGEGKAGIVRPMIHADDWKATGPSRLAALEDFGTRFIEVASMLETR